MNLTIEHWAGLSSVDRESLARNLANDLPNGFEFQTLRRCKLGKLENEVAFFVGAGSSFALLPGGRCTLGFDASGWEPTIDELESWKATAEEYGIEQRIQQHIAELTSRPRHASLSPILIEVEAKGSCWQEVSPDDARIQEFISKYGKHAGRKMGAKGHIVTSGRTKVRWDADGSIAAQIAPEITHSSLSLLLGREGFRLPTADEWEFACGAGASTLFRWGDHVPCDRYPTDGSPQAREWRTKWALSGGTLPYPSEGFASDWDLHERPNAFGLLVASNPYHNELVMEAGRSRGGDGGTRICGGAGFFVGWLPLATAFFDIDSCAIDPMQPLMPDHTCWRRVLELH